MWTLQNGRYDLRLWQAQEVGKDNIFGEGMGLDFRSLKEAFNMLILS